MSEPKTTGIDRASYAVQDAVTLLTMAGKEEAAERLERMWGRQSSGFVNAIVAIGAALTAGPAFQALCEPKEETWRDRPPML
jgi:hypothetical protein